MSRVRGLTPVFAVLILTLMTVAAAGAAFIWINTIQRQITTESQTGLETNLQRTHGELSIGSVWNVSNRLCLTVQNSGTVSYSEAQMGQFSLYVGEMPYRYNATAFAGMTTFQPGDIINICLCTPAQASSTDCVGPLPEGYSYLGGTVDVRIEPPLGTGDIYPNFRGS